MRALVQRVSSGSVDIFQKEYKQEIGKGLVILLGVSEDDNAAEVKYVAEKCANLRIFNDDNNKMNLSVNDVNGEVLIISQFTLYGNIQKGNRPSYNKAAKPQKARDLYNMFVKLVKEHIGEAKVKEGIFAAMMEVKIINDGPVTILVESK